MKKYRPYFTLEQLNHLSGVCIDFPTKRYLEKFIRDIDEGYRAANTEVEDPITVKLGMIPAEKETKYALEQQRRYENDEMSKEEQIEHELKNGMNADYTIFAPKVSKYSQE